MRTLLLLITYFSTLFSAAAQHTAKFTTPMSRSGGTPPLVIKGYFNLGYTNYVKNYRIQKLDSSYLFIRSKIHSGDVHDDYVEYENNEVANSDPNRTQRIYPRETLNIVYQDKKIGQNFTGIPTDSCWLFMAENGKIKLYTCYTPSEDVLDLESINAIQLNDGEIQKWDLEILKEIIKGNEKALQSFQNKRYVQAVRRFNKSKSTDSTR